MRDRGLLIPLVLVLFTVTSVAWAAGITCAYTQRDPVKEMSSVSTDDFKEENHEAATEGEVLSDNKTMRCPKRIEYCFALWEEEPNNKSQVVMLGQGCWESSGELDCKQSRCVSNTKPPKAANNTKWCCCSGSLCNVNVTDVYVPSTDEPLPVQPVPYVEQASIKKETVVIIVLGVVCSLVVACFVLIILYRLWSGFHKPDSLHLMEAPALSGGTPTYDLATLKLQEVIGRGRYGAVWRATLNDGDVAAKVFQHQHRQYYLNEKDIYTLPYLEHSSLLKFLGSEERVTPEGRTEYLIVLSYAPLGCLQDYLRAHIIDWTTLCRMSQSIAKGLAHLHIDIRKGDKVKPCIAHRDLNSRNILVKVDMSCAICDMGFAMKIAGSKYYSQSGEEQIAETTSLTDVGTLRYMAPEVLEGAVNLRDCESSLKQIDVYSLGLVVWEIMTRCEDLYQGLEVPAYRLPFEAEIGLHPTFEQMQVLISRNKARPLFSDVWKDSNQAVRLLKETIEDCWDQDAEARLTSLCVDERLQELPALWDRHRASMTVTGVSPTVNPTSTQLTTNRNSATIGSSNLVSLLHATAPAGTAYELIDRNGNIPGITDPQAFRSQSRGSYYQNRESSASEATVETTVTMSPSEPLVPPVPAPEPVVANKNANSQQMARNNHVQPLQPYQGRNPCIERNMIMEPLEEVSVSGNTLLERGSKYNSAAPVSNHRGVDVDIFDVLQLADNVESNSLVSNDVLNHTRTCNPIPYVQNAVHGSLPTRPKQPNVPGNGQHYDKKVKKGPFGGRFDRKKTSSSSGGEQNNKKVKDWGLKSLLDRKWGSKSNQTVVDNTLVQEGDNIQQAVANGLHHSKPKSNLALRAEENNKPVITEVCLLQQNRNDAAQVVIRPTNGPYKSIENGYVPNGACKTEVGVAHLTPTSMYNGQAPVVKCRSGGASSSTQLNGLLNCHSESDLLNPKVDSKLKRPTTLPLKSHGFKGLSQGDVNVFQVRQPRTCNDGTQSERAALLDDPKDTDEVSDSESPRIKIVKRVKTPFKIKPSRFSLYDDRMMSLSVDGYQNPSLPHARASLSVPVNMNSVCASSPSKNGLIDNTKCHVQPAKTSERPAALGKSEADRHAAAVGQQAVKPGMNGTAVLNGFLSNHWTMANGQPKNSEQDNNASTYQVSCL